MSDLDVLAQVKVLEDLLESHAYEEDSSLLESWKTAFDAALSTAERGPQWAVIIDQAEAAHTKLQEHLACLMVERDEVRAALYQGQTATRALKAYAPR